MSKFNKVIAAALITAGAFAASSAQAGAQFTVNPNSNGLVTPGPLPAPSSFIADALGGASSARIQQIGNSFNYTGQGYITYSAFQLNSQNVDAGTSYLNFSLPGSGVYGYGLYATFNQTFACNAALGTGVTCSVTSIALNLYADPLADGKTTFIAATPTSNAMVTPAGTQILLGSVNAGVGTAGIDAFGGAFQNINTNLILTDAGKNFFIAPTPFFTMTLNAFNNFSGGVSSDGTGNFAINDEHGNTGFGNVVPEPGSLALFGLALAGVAAAGRRKAK
jgi:hypothetical protein